MRFWLTSFFVLFALVKLVEWLRSLEVPFSVVVIAGLLLAIASNYDKRQLFPFWSDVRTARAMAADATAPGEVDSALSLTAVEAASTSPLSAPSTAKSEPTHGSIELPPFNN